MIAQPSCLIIDDSDVVRKVMRHVAEGLGFSVNDLTTTDEALARCRREMPYLIVLDWHLPGSVPLDFMSAVRSLPQGRQVKILYVLTENDPAEINRAIASGADDTLIKPFHRVTMEAKIAALITTKRELPDNEIEHLQRPLRAVLAAARLS